MGKFIKNLKSSLSYIKKYVKKLSNLSKTFTATVFENIKISDFNYVVQRQEKTKICFGSGSERKLLDFDKNGLVSKHARSNMREIYDVGPGSYDISVQTSALSGILNKPTSKLGTVLGGRKAERKALFTSAELILGPKYNIPTTFPKKVKQLCAPFNLGAERMSYNRPGIGTYKTIPYKRKRAVFAHSFGGTCLLPAIKMKCGLFICERCKEFLKGNHWCLNATEMTHKYGKMKTKATSQTLFLCQTCYALEKKENKIFSKGQI